MKKVANGFRVARQRVAVSDYRHEAHRPYTCVLRDLRDDTPVSEHGLIERLCKQAGAVDGDEIEIAVRKTGKRPFGDRRVVWVGPHSYQREPIREPEPREVSEC